jgi:DedD protein
VAQPVARPAPSEADRARALLEGRSVEPQPPAAASQRIVVQVGAFADANLAREARLKLERAGLKTYTHVAETPQGRRIRVRVGPFATQAEADKAAARVKALGLPAAILTL